PLFAHAAWRGMMEQRAIEATFASGEYVALGLAMDPAAVLAASADTSAAAAAARVRRSRVELERRLAAEPAVLGTTSASVLPLMYHPWRRVEVEGLAPSVLDSAAVPRVSS